MRRAAGARDQAREAGACVLAERAKGEGTTAAGRGRRRLRHVRWNLLYALKLR